MDNVYDLRASQLKGYLREFFAKPDLSPHLWEVAKACLDNKKTFFYAVKFFDDLSMSQFAQAVLLSSGKQFNWHFVKSYSLVQDSLDGTTLLTGYGDYDLVFVVHDRGTLQNKIMGQSINQVAVLRAPKKTFFFDRGGYIITDLLSPLASVGELVKWSAKSKSIVSGGDDL